MLACLEKDPERRPQSAAELRRRLEACPVEPWDAARARAWWLEHQPELERDAVESIGEARTVAVDATARSPSAAPLDAA